MSEARRSEISVTLDGTDITESLNKYLLSATYTDNEEDETDDLQITLQDRDGIWLESWLDSAIQSAAGSETEEVEKKYKITAQSSCVVHSETGNKCKSLGTLPYGTSISVKSIENGWAKIEYSGKTGYVKEAYLQEIYTSSDDSAEGTSESGGDFSDWKVGDEVMVSGRPQYTSYGTGTPGANVTSYKGTITNLNLKSGAQYPVHIGHLGWFSLAQVSHAGGAETEGASSRGSAAEGSSSEDGSSESSPPGVTEVSKGMKIQAAIMLHNWTTTGSLDKLDCGQFELDSVTAQGPPSTITIKGTSLPYSSSIRQVKKSKSWEKYSLSGIANEIASKNGMTCMFSSSTNPQYERVEQYRVSDIGFLQKLCHDAGLSLKITNNIMVIFDQETYESKASIKTITPGCGYTKYKLSTGENDTYTSCRVSYTDTDGKLITATVKAENAEGEDKQRLEIRQKVATADEAKALAKKMIRLHNKFAFTAEFTFPGEISLVAGCAVELKGWGAWDGKYIIKRAKITVSGSGCSNQITLRKALSVSSSASNESSSANSKAVDDLANEVIRGTWGNGEERKQKLTEAGYDYEAVQKRVNELML